MKLLQKRHIGHYTPHLIVLAALVLRLVHSDFSFSNDELSALRRLQVDDLGELFINGIMVDGHPAFTQVLLFYWQKLFGDHETVLRLPFILAGAWAVLLTIKIGDRWFHCQAGLFAGAAMAFLCFPILYSQIARPYAFGLAFTLWFAYRWGIVLMSEKPRVKDMIWMAVAAALCMLTHYFAGLSALVIGLGGFFLLKKHNWKLYLGAAIIAFLLFLPHLFITMHHMSIGGVGGPDGWLGSPGSEFLPRFFMYAFNDSYWVLGGILTIGIGSLLLRFKTIKIVPLQLLCLFFFVGTFLVGYFYSEYKNPVLQFSTLLFVFPFLLLLLFSFLPERLNKGWKQYLVIGFLALGSFFTIQVNQYYQKNHFGVFKDLAVVSQEWDEKYGAENIAHTYNVNNKYYLNYYFDKLDYHPEVLMYRMESLEEMPVFIELMKNSKADYFAFGWSTQTAFYECYEVIRKWYPHIVEDEVFFNARMTLFGRHSPTVPHVVYPNRKLLAKYEGLSQVETFLPFLEPNAATEPTHTSNDSVDSTNPYGFTYTLEGEALEKAKGKVIQFKAELHGVQPDSEAVLVIQTIRDGKTIDWHNTKLSWFNQYPNFNNDVWASRLIPENLEKHDVVKLFLWHTEGGAVSSSNFQVSLSSDPGFNNRIRSFK